MRRLIYTHDVSYDLKDLIISLFLSLFIDNEIGKLTSGSDERIRERIRLIESGPNKSEPETENDPTRALFRSQLSMFSLMAKVCDRKLEWEGGQMPLQLVVTSLMLPYLIMPGHTLILHRDINPLSHMH